MYSQTDFDNNKQAFRKELGKALLIALPFAVIAVAAFIKRIEWLCIGGCIGAGSVLILLWDLRIGPQRRYGRYLREIHSGLSRKTAGTLVSLGEDKVYTDGVWFYEMIINIYEDMSEEGERRFLFDCAKQRPDEWMGRDIAVTSHGNFVLDVSPLGEKQETHE